MYVNEATERFYDLLPEEPRVGISNVAQNMGELRKNYSDAGFPHFEPFGLSYHSVTNTIDDQVTAQKSLGMLYFKQPQVLDTAIGKFHHKYTEPFRQHLSGQEVPAHWDVLMNHELARTADKGVQAVLGYIAHIGGGDLAMTVYETEQSGEFSSEVMRDYVKHDYDKIDDSLAITAQRLAPVLMESANPKTRERKLRLAMGGVILGRKWARHDYRRLKRAKSEEKRQDIIHTAEQRAAKFATIVLETDYFQQEISSYLRNSRRSTFEIAA